MSRSKHDQPARPHSGKKCPEAANGGCTWCVTGYAKRAANKKTRVSGKRDVLQRAQDLLPDPYLGEDYESSPYCSEHQFQGGTCLRCGTQAHDAYDDGTCPTKQDDPPIVHAVPQRKDEAPS